jgi:hypothetical protein
MARKQAFPLHYYAMRGNVSPRADIGAVEQHCAASDRRLAANHYTVNLKDSIFKSVSLKLAAHSCTILELEHVRIDYLSEPAPQNHPASNSCAHCAKVQGQKQSSL